MIDRESSPIQTKRTACLVVQQSGETKLCVSLANAIFAKQKTKKAESANDRHAINTAKEASMQHLVLLAALSMMLLYVLIIVACLCYVGRHGRRAS
jgi:hypothetical protein